MLPLAQNHLDSEEDWHTLKTLLVLCRHDLRHEADELLQRLPSRLQSHRFTTAVTQYLAGASVSLDDLAIQLTQRELPAAWTLLERL